MDPLEDECIALQFNLVAKYKARHTLGYRRLKIKTPPPPAAAAATAVTAAATAAAAGLGEIVFFFFGLR